MVSSPASLLLVALLVFLNGLPRSQGWSADDENRLIRSLRTKYDKYVRPVWNSSDSVNVTFDITFNNIIDVDEKKQILTTSLWLRQTWTNQLARWNPKDYGGMESVMLQASDVWQPDIVIYQNIIKEFDGRLDHTSSRVRIQHTGVTHWSTPFVMVTLCKIEVSLFPFDSQECTLTFGSWQHNGREINILNDRKVAKLATNRVKNGEWSVSKVAVERILRTYQCCPGDNYPEVSFIIYMTRRSLFYFVNLILPNILITLLAFFSFFIPVECGERISFVITVLLSMTVFMLLVAESIPPTSEAVPLIGIFYTASMIEVFLALVGTGISLKINYSYLFGDGVSPRLRRLLFRSIGPLLGFNVKKILGEGYKQMQALSANGATRKRSVALTRMSVSLPTGASLPMTEELLMNTCQMEEDKPSGTKPLITGGESEVGADQLQVNKQLRYIADSFKEQAEGEKKVMECKLAAAIVDRLFLWLFTLCFLVSVGIILVYLPGRSSK